MNKREYLFLLVSEEAMEVAKEALKCMRFTPDHQHAAYTATNLERLQVEVTDLMTVLGLLEKELGTMFSHLTSEEKVTRTEKFMEISRQLGTLKE